MLSSSSTSESLSVSSTPTTPEPSFGDDFASHQESLTSTATFTLVIGGLGYIGSHTSLELLKVGYNVIIVDDLSNSFHSVFTRVRKLAEKYCHESHRSMPILHFHNLDYRSKSLRFLLESYSDLVTVPSSSPQGSPILTHRSKITGVIHFAAYKSVSESILKPAQYYRNNVCGLVELVELLGKHDIRNFVFSSSATVYGTKADGGHPLREEDLIHHPEVYMDENGKEQVRMPVVQGLLSPYARSKYFCEAILADMALSDPDWRIVALRYFNPIGCDRSGLLGEEARGVPSNLFPMISQVLTGERKELEIFGTDWDTRDGTAVRDFIHVSDLARGHIAALSADINTPFRSFNLGTGNGTTVMEAVASLEQASRQQIPVRLAPRRNGDVGSCVAANARSVKELGWSATESISQCAADLWNFILKQEVDRSPQVGDMY
ncbi:UDP-glucose 4-epimerase [Fusarium oxysporum f. sp. raphani 54005]|uniref:UDP-glucose 4-epimerase n=1 Tax=Fusarium oxysporum f. sp. raphani 54005 TaxID=1089458 RepID=X0CK72_FUSOX|nr:UDP-glucose 4-epimerase [Fusarium oxysporum f. sp. raphani 54005]KAJ4029021.1 hypothetical protein NW753_014395 [Fusarium oxysporum]KAJ4034907.1 hypothetical protein NW763_014138 [Fusarium oxysporum]KAJ4051383.1 hypothetical protein NW758_003726 [Fusarium oxysporum]KAJ4072797.1 hypothetical protein NW761_014625 [Fusarium oxysporum]